MNRPTLVERAFELARSGEIDSLENLRRRLNREGYQDVAGQISGPSLLRQLRDAILAAKSA